MYSRLNRRAIDQKIPGYFFIWYLSFIAIISGVLHCIQFQLYLSVLFRFVSAGFNGQKMLYFISNASVASMNRLVSPIISLVCIQQITKHTRFTVGLLQNT
uniref:Serpentine receptor class gamma n=1 Tax=Caenorhabditis tropicalis TaxID=1561998 RepID=A0A1I7UB58_9PELO